LAMCKSMRERVRSRDREGRTQRRSERGVSVLAMAAQNRAACHAAFKPR
jgi:hypothetical protein